MSSPWYKSESKGLGYLSDRLKVMLGLYTNMPGPRYVVDRDRSHNSLNLRGPPGLEVQDIAWKIWYVFAPQHHIVG